MTKVLISFYIVGIPSAEFQKINYSSLSLFKIVVIVMS